MSITIALVLACIALALSALSLLRCYVPPQSRQVRELQERVMDCEDAFDNVAARITKRAKDENMDKAREAFKSRRSAQDKVLEEAAAVIEAAKNNPAAAVRSGQQGELSLPADPEAAKAELRRRAGLH